MRRTMRVGGLAHRIRAATWLFALLMSGSRVAGVAAQGPLSPSTLQLAPPFPEASANGELSPPGAAQPPQGSVGGEPTLDESLFDEAAVEFAGGAVSCPVPSGWRAVEATAGREVRLALLPESAWTTKTTGGGVRGPRLEAAIDPVDGLWLAYHALPQADRRPLDELADWLKSRLGKGYEASTATPLLIQGWSALRLEFRRTTDQGMSTGFRWVVATEWGLCELQLCSPEDRASDRMRELTPCFSELRIGSPRVSAVPPTPAVRAAAPALGAWKAYRSRMRFDADGRVVIQFDPPAPRRLDGADSASEPTRLVGSFRAEGDLILVVWEDGSKRNYRWRREGSSLLLTDHRGHTSLLRQVLE